MTDGAVKRAWWKPPDALDPAVRRSLWGLVLASLVVGYFGILMVQTITYAAQSFGASTQDQGLALASVRIDFFVALLVVTLADRLGRTRVLRASIIGATIATAVSGLAPSFAFYTGSQVISKGLVSAAVVLVGIIAAEAAPKGSRAYVLGLMTLAGSAGAGICVLLLSTADASPDAWRYLYIGGLVSLPMVIAVKRLVPEPSRFLTRNTAVSLRGYWRPLLMLSCGAILLSVFATPTIEFKNDWLSTERSYSAAQISLYNVIAYGPALLGIMAGGRLADRFGRKRIAIIGIVGAVFGGVASYLSYGYLGVFGWSMLSGLFTGLAVTPLAVYRPELFPTALRGKANGVIGGASRIGAALGLVLAPAIAGGGPIGNGIAVLAIGPLLLIILIVAAYPETSGQSLEELHPVDDYPT